MNSKLLHQHLLNYPFSPTVWNAILIRYWLSHILDPVFWTVLCSADLSVPSMWLLGRTGPFSLYFVFEIFLAIFTCFSRWNFKSICWVPKWVPLEFRMSFYFIHRSFWGELMPLQYCLLIKRSEITLFWFLIPLFFCLLICFKWFLYISFKAYF